jgi:hypothetical protein
MTADYSSYLDLFSLPGLLLFATHIQSGVLIHLLRETHPEVWARLGRPFVISGWRVLPYCAARKYRELPVGPVRTVAKATGVLTWLSIGFTIAYVVLVVQDVGGPAAA